MCAPTLFASFATPAMISTAGSAPFLPFRGGTPRETRRPTGVAPSAARSESAAPAARNPISLKSSQSVRKWTPSSDASMLTANVVVPRGTSAQSSPRLSVSRHHDGVPNLSQRVDRNAQAGAIDELHRSGDRIGAGKHLAQPQRCSYPQRVAHHEQADHRQRTRTERRDLVIGSN